VAPVTFVLSVPFNSVGDGDEAQLGHSVDISQEGTVRNSARLIAFALFGVVCHLCVAQASGSRPSGATCLCKDGTYSRNVKRSKACVGHSGVKDWYAVEKTTGGGSTNSRQDSTDTSKAHSLQEGAAKTASESATPPATIPSSVASAPQPSDGGAKTPLRVVGGAPDLVWLATPSATYYCYGAELYGIGTAGKYMNESEAIAKGAHSSLGKNCSK